MIPVSQENSVSSSKDEFKKNLTRLFMFFAGAAGLLFFSARLNAAERTITLDEAYKMAIATHESVKIAGEGVAQAETNIDRANSQLLPNVTIDGNYTKYSKAQTSQGFVIQPNQSSSADLKVTQPIYNGGKDWSARRQAYILLGRSREGLGFSKDTIVITTAQAYFNLLKAKKNVGIKRAALKRAREQSDVAAARFKVGEVTKSAVLRADAETAGAEADLINAETNLTDAKTVLKRIIGSPEDFDVAEPPPGPEMTASLDELINTAYSQRRDYRQSTLDKKVAAEGIEFAKGGFYPSLRLEGLYTAGDQSPKTAFFQGQSLSGSVVLTFPIFEGGLRKAEVAQAKSVYAQADLVTLSLKRDIAVQVREAYDRLKALKAVTESFRKQVSFAEENYRMVFEQFKFGIATTVDVIDADTTLISAQSSLSNSTYDQAFAAVELKYNVGAVMEEIASK